MIDFKLTKIHKILDTDDTLRFLFMLVIVMGYIGPMTIVQTTHNAWGLLGMIPSLYVTLTRMLYIHEGRRRG